MTTAIPRLLIACAAFLLAACTNFGRIGPEAPPPGEDESIIVLGARPANFSFTMFPAREKEGKVIAGNGAMAAISGVPKEGYLVGRAKAGDLLALVYFYRVDASGAGVPFTGVWTCDDSRAKTFVVPKGKVIYVGDAVMAPDGTSVRQAYNLGAARAHLDANYPRLAGRLEHWETAMKGVWIECAGDKKKTIELQ